MEFGEIFRDYIYKKIDGMVVIFFFRGKDFKREIGKYKEIFLKEFEVNINMINNLLSIVFRFFFYEIFSVFYRSIVN